MSQIIDLTTARARRSHPAAAAPDPATAKARQRTRRLATLASVATVLALPVLAVDAADAAQRTPAPTGTSSTAATTDLAGPGRTDGGATCRGEAAELVTDGDWYGTAERDVVVVTGPSTVVWAGLGDDLICVHNAGYHGSEIRGGPGDDVIITYGGMNDVFGDGNDDVILGNGAGEHLEGGDGNDSIKTSGPSYLYGNAGNDRLLGSGADDTLNGGDGDDLLYGFGGVDQLIGGTGADELHGGAAYDHLDGSVDAQVDTCVDAAGLANGAAMAGCDVITLTPAAGFGGFSS